MNRESDRGKIIDFQVAKDRLGRGEEQKPEMASAQKPAELPDVLRQEMEYQQTEFQEQLAQVDLRLARIRVALTGMGRRINQEQALRGLTTLEQNAARLKELPLIEQMKIWQRIDSSIRTMETALGIEALK